MRRSAVIRGRVLPSSIFQQQEGSMRKNWWLIASVAASVWFFAVGGLADEPKGTATLSDRVGSWHQVTSRLGAQEKKAGEGQPSKILHLTPTGFTRIVYEPKTRKVLGIVGGRHVFEGQNYTEIIEYADEGTRKMGKVDADFRMTFALKVEGDRLELKASAGGQDYVEVWERIK
jgi:hypothetical protein